jgi:FMN-dependent NADH-azoreductase
VANAFLDAYQAANASDEIMTLDLFEATLPTFDGFVLQAKYNIMHGRKHSESQAAAWQAVEDVIEEFKSADKYVVSNPMWNFGICYRLKHYIDVITQPGYTFTVTPEGRYEGLVTDKPLLLIHARGGAYPEGSDMAGLDFQRGYLQTLFGFIGFTDIRHLPVESTLSPEAESSQAAAIEKAKELAGAF